jgi:CarboxypepD_reg-like domain
MKSRSPLFYIFSLLLFFFFLCFSQNTFAQASIKGKILYKRESLPASFVSIELLKHKEKKTMSDKAGYFQLPVTEAEKKDTVIISSVGYQSIKMPVTEALTKSVFTLPEMVKTIDGVTVFNSHEVIGSMSESVGYYRSWNNEHTGGEIGRVFYLPYDKFKIDKIRFKAGNTCDTCLLRLHIRYIENGAPGDEIINDSISLYVYNLSLDSKVSEFDLTPYDFTFKEKHFFVGLEVLNCGNGTKGKCAFSFAGTEKGEYLYKTRPYNDWETSDDYTIYLKLFLRF